MLKLRHSRALPAGALAAGGFAVVISLSACSADVSRTFGFTRDAPDEFEVTTRAPLSMPPDYTLRPPRPGATRPQEMTAPRAAESALAPQAALGPGPTGSSGSAGSSTSGEQALVAAAGAPAPANIRRQIDADAAVDANSRSFTDYLMFWRTPAAATGVAVDPQKEADRLRANAALGQNVNQGSTPIIVEKKPGIWQSLFGWL